MIVAAIGGAHKRFYSRVKKLLASIFTTQRKQIFAREHCLKFCIMRTNIIQNI